MSNPRDVSLLWDIARAAERIVAFTQEMDLPGFLSDTRTNLAVQHQILVIGEAAKRLSPACRRQLSGIPWSGIARMRDRLIHGYDTVDLEIVWDTVQRSIPNMLGVIRDYLPDSKQE